MDYKIRRANIEDAKSVNELLTLLIRDEKKYDININEECVIERLYEDIILNENSIVLIAEKNKKILGYLFGYIIENGNAYLEKSAKLEALYIDEKNRKNGIATSLIEKFKIWSKEKKVKYIEVQVLNNNANAYNLYKKEEFKEFKSTLLMDLNEEDEIK